MKTWSASVLVDFHAHSHSFLSLSVHSSLAESSEGDVDSESTNSYLFAVEQRIKLWSKDASVIELGKLALGLETGPTVPYWDSFEKSDLYT